MCRWPFITSFQCIMKSCKSAQSDHLLCHLAFKKVQKLDVLVLNSIFQLLSIAEQAGLSRVQDPKD